MSESDTTKIRHTPGPWEVKDLELGPCVVSESAFICELDGDSDEEEYANARLIAAAPDLLEACKALVRFYEAAEYQGPVNAIEQAKAAIARAEGE